jgi:hypothetical protein
MSEDFPASSNPNSIDFIPKIPINKNVFDTLVFYAAARLVDVELNSDKRLSSSYSTEVDSIAFNQKNNLASK